MSGATTTALDSQEWESMKTRVSVTSTALELEFHEEDHCADMAKTHLMAGAWGEDLPQLIKLDLGEHAGKYSDC